MKDLHVSTPPRRGRAGVRALLMVTALAGALAACDALLGIGDYQDRVADGGADGTAGGADGSVGPDADGAEGTESGTDAGTDAANDPDAPRTKTDASCSFRDTIFALGAFPSRILAFPRTANGVVAPVGRLDAPNGTGMALDPAHDELFLLLDPLGGNKVQTFTAAPDGGSGPTRSFNVSGRAVAFAGDEIFVTYDDTISVFARTAANNPLPIRQIYKPGLGYLGHIVVDVVHDEIFVTNDGQYMVSVFGRTDTGDAGAKRAFNMGANPSGIAVDVARDVIYIAERDYGIRVYARTATDGTMVLRRAHLNTASAREIQGIAFDETNDELWLSEGVPDGAIVALSAAAIAAIPVGATMDVAPVRSIQDADGGLRAVSVAVCP